jgi:hypothetical protein
MGLLVDLFKSLFCVLPLITEPSIKFMFWFFRILDEYGYIILGTIIVFNLVISIVDHGRFATITDELRPDHSIYNKYIVIFLFINN